MRKTIALLAAVIFAIELATIESVITIYAQIISSCAFLALLFYLILKTEGLIDNYSTPQNPQTPQKRGKNRPKTKSKAKPEPKPKQESKLKSKKDAKEEEETTFTQEWHNLEKEAK